MNIRETIKYKNEFIKVIEMSPKTSPPKPPRIEVLWKRVVGRKISVRVRFNYPKENRSVEKGFTLRSDIQTKEDLEEELKILYEQYRPRPLPSNLVDVETIDW